MKRTIGNLLIIFSFFLLLYIYFPLLTAYLPSSTPQVLAADNQYTISIPKINAQAAIVEDVDPGDKAAYQKALQKGVAQSKGFAKIGEGKLVYLFAHSSLPPWEMTRTNTPFLRLGELRAGDRIEIRKYNGYNNYNDYKNYTYAVTSKIELWPNQTEIFDQEKDKDELLLQTCTPIGTDLKRLLIFAKPI